MDPTKLEAIIEWPVPRTIHDIRSFHWLASFYRRFIRNFITIIAYITECLKGGHFQWTIEASKAFEELKVKVGAQNQVADALSRCYSLLSTMSVQVLGFDTFRDLYRNDPDFQDIWAACGSGSFQ
uniref:Reverse transcriptase/retrotransposon-derived protein RNase H-like domain-containing protein n=1 Tax=Lactuca sativa TaxID=4236 RepID=A0A9R1V1P9_LACSA|nr:hypothetical protein LSAT_V11C700358930 [Lactuca sativa]